MPAVPCGCGLWSASAISLRFPGDNFVSGVTNPIGPPGVPRPSYTFPAPRGKGDEGYCGCLDIPRSEQLSVTLVTYSCKAPGSCPVASRHWERKIGLTGSGRFRLTPNWSSSRWHSGSGLDKGECKGGSASRGESHSRPFQGLWDMDGNHICLDCPALIRPMKAPMPAPLAFQFWTGAPAAQDALRIAMAMNSLSI